MLNTDTIIVGADIEVKSSCMVCGDSTWVVMSREEWAAINDGSMGDGLPFDQALLLITGTCHYCTEGAGA